MPFDPSYLELAKQCVDRRRAKASGRLVVTVVGIPGSGKTTLATSVADQINSNYDEKALVVSMDGFHYTRKQLDMMDDPERAHRLRGAPFTFDAEGVALLASNLQGTAAVPTFDHALKDPVPGATIDDDVTIILFEGLYLHLNYEPWSRIASYSDWKWQVNTPIDTARERLAQRHLVSGIVQTVEQGIDRANFNDIPNGEHILANSIEPDLYISSK